MSYHGNLARPAYLSSDSKQKAATNCKLIEIKENIGRNGNHFIKDPLFIFSEKNMRAYIEYRKSIMSD
jgi:hypothetical protein